MKNLFFLGIMIFLIACEGESGNNSKTLGLEANFKEVAASMAEGKKEEKKEVRPYVSEEGGFSIVFPDSPQVKKELINSEHGPIKLTQLLYEKEKTKAWIASFSDYPPPLVELGNSSQLLVGIQNQILDVLGTKASHQQKITLAKKYQGLAFEAYSSKQKMDILYRIYLVKNRVYQLGMYSSVGKFSAQDSSDFMGSFRLIE